MLSPLLCWCFVIFAFDYLPRDKISRRTTLAFSGDHGNADSPELPKMNCENRWHAYRPQQNQVYVRRRPLGLTSRETNGDIASNVEVPGAVAKVAPNVYLDLLAPTSSFSSLDEVALFDLARFEAGIAS